MLTAQIAVSVGNMLQDIYDTPVSQVLQNSNAAHDFALSTDSAAWASWAEYFAEQLVAFPKTQFGRLYFGRSTGEICGVQQLAAGALLMYGSCSQGTCSWLLDSYGNPVDYPSGGILLGPRLNATQAPWWQPAAQRRSAAWSDPRRVGSDLVRSFSAPVLQGGAVTSVFGIDFSLSQLQSQLQHVDLLPTHSVVATADLDGAVIASSHASVAALASNSDERQNVLTCADDRVRCAARHFLQNIAADNASLAFFTNSSTPMVDRILCAGEKLYVSLANYVDQIGSATAVFVVTPEDDFTSALRRSTRVTLGSFCAILFAYAAVAAADLYLFARTSDCAASPAVADSSCDDVESCMQRAIRALRSAVESQQDSAVVAPLEVAISLLSQSSRLFQPNPEKDVVGRELRDWIRTNEAVPACAFPGQSIADLDVVVDQAAAYFEQHSIYSWDFNIFDLCTSLNASGGIANVLYVCLLEIFKTRNLVDSLPVSFPQLKIFAHELERRYSFPNPYHNCLHAADVTICLNYVLQPAVIETLELSPLEIFFVILAAAGHDVGHDGRNNSFHVAIESDRAVAFNGKSVQENFHVRTLLQLMKDCGLWASMDPADVKYAKNIITEVILATDMALHFDFTGKLSSRLENPVFRPSDTADKLLILQMLLKFSDISNPTKPLPLVRRWSGRVVAEFFCQGDAEAELGLPISAFMDRNNANVIKSQQGFVKFIVLPMLELVGRLFSADVFEEPRKHLAESLDYWHSESPSVEEYE
eukprot:TRINITY_DN2124_c0_g1_i5.p1 TRINITY_DN2124_c0_g1~~TRINITY_DN2124_c0_g1_i5.p1  ORF type:complete len:760 (+),score=140.92 TRINITY_DN2124_c0_g1_i5:1029-3308(+)